MSEAGKGFMGRFRDLIILFLMIAVVPAIAVALPPDSENGAAVANVKGSGVTEAQRRESIAVTIPPQRFFLKKIAGEWIDCFVLIPSGANHDVVETTISQARALAVSKILFSIGHPKNIAEQTWIERIGEIAPKLQVVPTLNEVDFKSNDIHVWTSSRLMQKIVQTMGEKVGELLPNHREDIARRTAESIKDIEAVANQLHVKLAPFQGETFLVLHPSWGYFAAEYGLKQLAIEADEKEPGPGQLRELMREARSVGIKRVYIDRGYSAAAIAPFSEALALNAETVDVLAENWPAEMETLGSLLSEEFALRRAAKK